MSQSYRLCAECGGERLFLQHHEPAGTCPDSVDGECPEWSCTECGSAILAGFALYRAEPDIMSHLPGRVA